MVQDKPNFSEDRAVNKTRKVNEDAAELQDEQSKPKRVLTEAQRLAFLKGREKRMANIERKRQEKLEAESVNHDPIIHPTPSIPEPDPDPEPKPETTPLREENDVLDQQPTTPVKVEEPIPVMPTLRRHANSDETAKKIADLILERMEMGKRAAPENTTPPPKKSRGRPRTKEVPIRELLSSEEDSSPSPPPTTYVPPQRVFNWM